MRLEGRWAKLAAGAAWLGVSAAVLYAAATLHLRSAALGGPVPYSDEAAHAAKTAELAWDAARAPGPWERLAVLLFSGDSYPNALYDVALALGAATMAELRAATLPFLLIHLGLALWFGPSLWGRAGALAYAALVGFTAYPLAFARLYYLDVPLVACVGGAAICIAASRGFSRALPTLVFVLVATVGLYTKWTWAAFCAAPCLLAALRALGPLPGWRARAAGAAALLAVVLAGAWLVREAGGVATGPLPDRWTALARVAVAVRLLALWAAIEALAWGAGRLRLGDRLAVRLRTPALRRPSNGAPGFALDPARRLAAIRVGARPFVPLVRAALAFALVGGLAGPWYALVWSSLLGRYDHENAVMGERAGVLAEAGRTLPELLPAGPVLLAVGLVVALARREGRGTWLAGLLGAATGVALALAWLPADVRYLLPALPLAAGAVVAGWRAASLRLTAPLLAVALAIAWVTGIAPVVGRPPLGAAAASEQNGVDVARRALRGWTFPVLASPTATEHPAEVAALVDAVVQGCAATGAGSIERPCRVTWRARPRSPLTARALLALVKLRGVNAQEGRPGDPPGGLSGGLDTRAVAAAAWEGATWWGPFGDGSAWVRAPVGASSSAPTAAASAPIVAALAPTAPRGPAAAPQRASLPPLPDPVPGGTCPADMAPVPAVNPRFCIDRYEAHVVDDVARSEPGVLPTVGLTFDEAASACARAEVRGPDGAVRGHKRLARAIEWEDAADGHVGSGGRAFPYGDTWVSGRCNVPDLPGTQAPGGLGPTGAFGDCRTPEGVHDQLGNAWEWTDSDLRLDVAGWLRDAAPLGVHRDGDGLRADASADLTRLRPVFNAVPDDALTALADGALGLSVSSTDRDMYLAGFLAIGTPADPPRFLPVHLADADPATPGLRRLLVHADDDGAPLPDKRGCAWYAGASDACGVFGAALGHPHGFTGTIAARCTADPLSP